MKTISAGSLFGNKIIMPEQENEDGPQFSADIFLSACMICQQLFYVFAVEPVSSFPGKEILEKCLKIGALHPLPGGHGKAPLGAV